MTKKSTVVAALTLSAAILTAGAAPALAGTPAIVTPAPEIYAIGYDNYTVYAVDTTTGIGDPRPNPITDTWVNGEEMLAGSFDPSTGKLMVVPSKTDSCNIWSVDTTSGIGTNTGIAPTGALPNGATSNLICLAMAYAPDGTLYLQIRDRSAGPAVGNYLVEVDKATGEMLEFWPMPAGGSLPSGGATVNFMVFSPVDGDLYAQTSDADDDMYVFDFVSGTWTNVANGGNKTLYGAAFLPDGRILGNSWSDLVDTDLATLNTWDTIGTISNADIGVLVNGTNYWPQPEAAPEALAATGFDARTAIIVGALALLSVAGGALLVVRRRSA